ncbi:MAG: glycosyltransferase family 2 protein [Phycisphaerales bacterium]|nr:glycosyltransferase [Planctomycetota bacterium]MCH8508434.1 glycosyltransferase family 2 protein [Phycisphaerales bacterium]
MPSPFLDILFGILLVGSVVLLVYWTAAMVQIVRTTRRLPTARSGVAMADEKPPTEKVCIIVPAHNEAGTIAGLIASLRAQDYDRLRVVLALDRCTDDTRGVAERAIDRDPRFEIIEINACPDDWAGKVHAAWTGFERSGHAQNAEVLIFTDADTWFDPSCVRACVALARRRRLDMLSLFCTLTTDTWFERVVQTAAGFELARQYPLLRANMEDHRRRRPFANGQFMLFDAGAYRAIGGHESVKDALLEDIAFSRRIASSQMRGGLLLADGMVRCRMYDDWAQFRKGWKRIYTESANREPGRLRRYAWRSGLLGAGLPLMAAAGLVLALTLGDGPTMVLGGGLCAAALIVWLSGLVTIYRSSGARTEDVLYFPIGAWLVGSIYREAWRDLVQGKPTSWGGREYVRPVGGGGV